MTDSKHRSISELGKAKEALSSRSTTTYTRPVSMFVVRHRQGKAGRVLERESYPWRMLKVLKASPHELEKAQLEAGGFSVTVRHRARSPYTTQGC